jgi:hypothetical protein
MMKVTSCSRLAILAALTLPGLQATTLFVTGDLRTNATVASCGPGCTLGAINSDADFAQWAAVVTQFVVSSATPMQAITYSFGGGTSQNGTVVAPGGLEPYLSLFDASGNFLASTYFGTTCPLGSGTFGGNCYDVLLDAGTLNPGTYYIAISAYLNMSLAENNGFGTLADGFTGLGNLGPGENLHYAFDIQLPADTPEPGPLTLLVLGGGVFSLRKRFSGKNNQETQEDFR